MFEKNSLFCANVIFTYPALQMLSTKLWSLTIMLTFDRRDPERKIELDKIVLECIESLDQEHDDVVREVVNFTLTRV